MSTVNPNPTTCQSIAGKDGGASCVSNVLNAVGKWGTALTGILQGKPVATSKTGVAVGAKGSTGFSNTLTPGTMLLILAVIGILIYIATRK
jgi:hypothetical protein